MGRGGNDRQSEGQQSHTHEDSERFTRYHKNVYMPEDVRAAAEQFLPPIRTPLRLSLHYSEIMGQRRLPSSLYMPRTWSIVEVAVAKRTMAVYRVMIRFPWNKRSDFAMVLEGDYEVVTGYWVNPNDTHTTLDVSRYEARPLSAAELALTQVIEREVLGAGS